MVRSSKSNEALPTEAATPDQTATLPPGFVATRLAAALERSERSICYIALNEDGAERIAKALSELFPKVATILFPPWDCLPYDRVPPSRHCMGRRMDALRIWSTRGGRPRLVLTSLDATLQRIPPATVIAKSHFDLAVGELFDRMAFTDFIRKTGYVEDGVADDPGEVAIRDSVIDIYPAGAPGPMRIVLARNGDVEELRGFDRLSQRTESFLDRVTFGPASELVLSDGDKNGSSAKLEVMERHLLRCYESMPSLIDFLESGPVHLAPAATERVGRYFEIIEDARSARGGSAHADTLAASFYLTRSEWDQKIANSANLGLSGGADLSTEIHAENTRSGLIEMIKTLLSRDLKVVIAGRGKAAESLCRRATRASGMAAESVESWDKILEAEPGTLLQMAIELQDSFVDTVAKVAVVAVPEVRTGNVSNAYLAEPEIRIGDVIVHEEHGVGVLESLENVVIEGLSRDTARLTYRDGSSILVPAEDFGKLWRYGSEPDAVTLDRLHTDAWMKKREKIAADIQSTARHLLNLARQLLASQAEKIVPPRAEFSDFVRRFPYAETADQAQAIRAVLADLESGKPMNRLVCGDVGFGKTEIALRAAAAVALRGRQVAIIAPTTVLARQHFATFERRFAGTGIKVGMLSRLLKPNAAKQVKEALANGDIGVVIATQAILAKDIKFSRLSLMIVDEEHRFGLKEKRAMAKLAPSIHSLTMSATPIPRTLQAAMIGVQDVSLLTTAPLKRLPVRTSLLALDRPSLRIGLMREYRRGGQSFVVVPRIEDIDGVQTMLQKLVPELSVKVAHGKMPAIAIDETIVRFAEGDGDVLLATNIIENGLDIPRANSIFILSAERFGLAQLHQLRGRVGRSGAQGIAYLFAEEGAELAEETRLRLSALVENDRLGSGFAIGLRDLELRGGGDITGDDQAGHIKVLGIGLYQKLLAGAVARLRKQSSLRTAHAVLNIGVTGTIPCDYVSDAAVRLNLYAKLLRADSARQIDDLEEEFEDRFGRPPDDVTLLLRTTRLQTAAARVGFAKLEGGPKAMAITLSAKTPSKLISKMTKKTGAVHRDGRLIFETAHKAGEDQLRFFERIIASAYR